MAPFAIQQSDFIVGREGTRPCWLGKMARSIKGDRCGWPRKDMMEDAGPARDLFLFVRLDEMAQGWRDPTSGHRPGVLMFWGGFS